MNAWQNTTLRAISLALVLTMVPQTATGSEAEPADGTRTKKVRQASSLDLRDSDTKLKVQKGDLVAVPIPMSDPTLGTGLILGAGYFYPQTAAQKEAQPASMTAVAGMYTSNKSYAYGVAQQSYWNADRWRFSGAVGYANLNLDLLAPTDDGSEVWAKWAIEGGFVFADLARHLSNHWYLGLSARYVEVDQAVSRAGSSDPRLLQGEIRSVGIGPNLKFDSRDMPTNPYSGRQIELATLFNYELLGSEQSYQTYTASYSSYHSLTGKLVLAWEVEGCTKNGQVPLWDACRLGLRGFPATQYMAESSALAQVEARWRFARRWGVVAFAGAGTVDGALASSQDNQLVPSIGFGLRWMVLPAKRLNLRLDYGTSDGGEAIYFSVGEAF